MHHYSIGIVTTVKLTSCKFKVIGVNKMEEQKEKSGFFDIPVIKRCNNPSHNPPSHMVIPNGKGYKHVCPACGKVSIIYGSNYSM